MQSPEVWLSSEQIYCLACQGELKRERELIGWPATESSSGRRWRALVGVEPVLIDKTAVT